MNRFTFGVTGFEPTEKPNRQSERPKHVFHLVRIALSTPRGSRSLSAEALQNFTNWNREDVSQGAGQFFEPVETRSSISTGGSGLLTGSRRGRPDIVLITLDAARRDHFSSYGYSRPTTPNIDLFAEESLADEAATLAEYLNGAGYRTACITATPNSSRSLVTDQGYEEFFELWTEISKEESIDPHVLSARAVDWLDQNQTAEPLHLQLHFVPPHAPYRPAPPYDLFTKPNYEGPFNGFPSSILRNRKGQNPAPPTSSTSSRAMTATSGRQTAG